MTTCVIVVNVSYKMFKWLPTICDVMDDDVRRKFYVSHLLWFKTRALEHGEAFC
jgi:hypothetical protein